MSTRARDGDDKRGAAKAGGLRLLVGTWPRRIAAAVGSAFLAWLIAYFGVPIWERAAEDTGIAAAPLSVDVISDPARLPDGATGFPPELLIPRPIAEVEAPPDANGGSEARRWSWGHRLGGFDAYQTFVRVAVSGTSSTSVVLQNLRVGVVERRPQATGALLTYEGLGSAITPRLLLVNLDEHPPTVVTQDGPSFPLRINESDIEVLDINAGTSTCDCRWVAELEWTAGDRSGVLRIDDRGTPFRTAAPSDEARKYTWENGAWSGLR